MQACSAHGARWLFAPGSCCWLQRGRKMKGAPPPRGGWLLCQRQRHSAAAYCTQIQTELGRGSRRSCATAWAPAPAGQSSAARAQASGCNEREGRAAGWRPRVGAAPTGAAALLGTVKARPLQPLGCRAASASPGAAAGGCQGWPAPARTLRATLCVHRLGSMGWWRQEAIRRAPGSFSAPAPWHEYPRCRAQIPPTKAGKVEP